MNTEKIQVTLTLWEIDALWYAGQNAIRNGAMFPNAKSVLLNALHSLNVATEEVDAKILDTRESVGL